MGKYELITLDVDGTLLNSRLELTRGNRVAIERACAAGFCVALSTGRCLAEIREVVGDMPQIRYMICENGAIVYDRQLDRTLHVDPVPAVEVRYILDCVEGERLTIQVFHENRSYFNRPNPDFAQSCGVGEYRDTFSRSGLFDEHIFDDFDARSFIIEKVNLYFEADAARVRVWEKLKGRPLKLAPSIGHMLECVSVNADKGRGLRMLCAQLKLPLESVIAVGDSMNDVEILRAAGLAVAMGNACAGAKAAADVIAPDCDHDGVAWTIERYLLP